jgi:chromosome segregation ATPase
MSEQYRVSVVFEGRDQLSATVKQVAANMGETASLTSRVAEVTEKLKARTSDATEAYTKMRSELREAAFAANAVERAFKIQHSTIGDVIGVLNGLSNMIGRVQTMFTQYQVTQIRLEEIKERVVRAEAKYAEAVAKSGAGSAEATRAARELADAKRDLEIATMQANAQLIGFALQMPGLAKNVFDMAAKLANLGVGFHSLNNAVQAASTAIVGFGASVKAALPTLLSLAGVFTAIAGGFILVQDAAARAAPGLEDFVRGARDWRDAMRPDFVKQTTQAISEQAKTVAESTEALGWFAGEFDDVNKNMEETVRKGGNLQNVLKNLASAFGLPGDRIAALINQMFGLNITYDQHADLVAKLTKELGLNEEQARQLINTLTTQAEIQKTVEEATRNAEKAAREQEATYRKLVQTLNENINTLLNFGQVQGPLTNTLNNIRGALADLGNSISENVKGKIEEALRYFEEVNTKFRELETNSKLAGAANQVAGIGLSYYNAQTAVSKALIVDEVQALDARISRLKEEIATRQEALREAERQGREMEAVYVQMRQELDALKQELQARTQEREALIASTELTQEQAASKERLSAIQSVLSFTTNQLSLMQTGLQLAMMGATETGGMFMNAILALTDAQMDGIVTEEEMKNVLQQLGVTFDETGRPVMNLKGFLEKFKQEVLENINKVNEFRATLQSLNGMTIHTYHYHHIITTTGGGTTTVVDPYGRGTVENVNPNTLQHYQRGTAFVPFTGPAILHRGEMVIPRELADLIREGGFGPRGLSVQVYVDASKVSDPEEVARRVSRELVRRLRAM